MKTHSSRNFRVSGQAQHGFKSEFCAGEDGQVSTEKFTEVDIKKYKKLEPVSYAQGQVHTFVIKATLTIQCIYYYLIMMAGRSLLKAS